MDVAAVALSNLPASLRSLSRGRQACKCSEKCVDEAECMAAEFGADAELGSDRSLSLGLGRMSMDHCTESTDASFAAAFELQRAHAVIMRASVCVRIVRAWPKGGGGGASCPVEVFC